MKSFKSQTSTWSKRKQTEFDVYFLRKLSPYSLSPAVLPSFFINCRWTLAAGITAAPLKHRWKACPLFADTLFYTSVQTIIFSSSLSVSIPPVANTWYTIFFILLLQPHLVYCRLDEIIHSSISSMSEGICLEILSLSSMAGLETPLLCWRRHIACL